MLIWSLLLYSADPRDEWGSQTIPNSNVHPLGKVGAGQGPPAGAGKLRLGVPDSGQRMESESVARIQRITFTHWSVLHHQSQSTRDGDQAAVMGNHLLWSQGGWGCGLPHRNGRSLCSNKVQLFARRSQLQHQPLPVTLWESNATGAGYYDWRTLRQILLEVKNQEYFFFYPDFKIGL